MIQELGVGIVYSPGSQEFLESNSDLLDYLEIEPQTFWIKRSGLDSYVFDIEIGNYLKNLGKPFIFHGVGFPVGSHFQDFTHINCLHEMMKDLNPKWMSEHLSFNTFDSNGNKINTNFLLPPLQTHENCELISCTIKNYQDKVGLPFAFETATNYFKKQLFELEDSHFISQIAEKSDCHILLDIHNIWANQLNGRQSVEDLVNKIPTERVIEIHLASGFWFKNYYLDAHSDIVSDELFELSSRIIRKLPNLKGITFEILPDYLPFTESKSLRTNIEGIKRLWDSRGKDCHYPKAKRKIDEIITEIKVEPTPSAIEWENLIGALSIRMSPLESKHINLIADDLGLGIVQELIDKFRASALVATLKFTCRYIIKVYGSDYLLSIFKEFWKGCPPKLFAVETGLDFSTYLLTNTGMEIFKLPYLKELITYEYQSLQSIYYEKDVNYSSDANPIDILNSLLDNDFEFSKIERGNYEVTIKKEDYSNEFNKLNGTFHS